MRSRNILTVFSNNFLPDKVCGFSESIIIMVSRPILKTEMKQRSFYLLMITEGFKPIDNKRLKTGDNKELKKKMKRSSCLSSSSLEHHNDVNCPVIKSLSEK